MIPREQARFSRTLARVVALPLLLILVVAAILLLQIFRLLDAARWVNHTDLVIAQAARTQNLLLNLETGFRGYLLTNKSEFLQPFKKARPEIEHSFSQLEKLVSDNPPQVDRIHKLHRTANAWTQYADGAIQLRNRSADYVAYVSKGEGKHLMELIRDEFSEFVAVEEGLRATRSRTEQAFATTTLWSVGGLALVVGLVIAWLVARELSGLSQIYRRALDAAQSAAERATVERERFKITLSSIGDAVIATDSQGNVTFFNAVASKLTGWAIEEAIGKPLGDVFHIISEETNLPCEDPVARVIRDGQVIGLANHTALVAKDGTLCSIEDSAAPIKDDDENTKGAVLVFRDITIERQAARERADLIVREQSARLAAERSGEQLRFLAEASRTLASSLDYQTTLDQVAHLVVPVLADWCDIQVLDEDGVIRRVAVTHSDPEKVALAYEMDRRYPVNPNNPRGVPNVLRTGKSEIYYEIPDEMLVAGAQDEEHLRISRELGLQSAVIVPLTARGHTLGVITLVYAESGRHYSDDDLGLVEDLALRAGAAVDNARLYTEARLGISLHEDLERKLTSLTEATSTLVTSLNLDRLLPEILALARRLAPADAYAVWRVNEISHLWERPVAEGLSASYISVVAENGQSGGMPDRPLIIEDIDQEPMMEGRKADLEREGLRSLLVMPLHRHEAVIGTLVFYYRTPHRFDSMQLRVAEAIANIASSAISTAALYHELQQRADELLEADRLKDQFLAMLAHELRNPLGAILNAHEVMGAAALSSEAYHRAMGVIGRQGQHMARLVDQLLDVSRISHGKIELHRERLELVGLVHVTCEDHRRILDAKGIALHLSLGDDPLWVEGDATRLRQAVGNLLQNAAKFTAEGGNVTVRIQTSKMGSTVQISVIDSGTGIPLDVLPRLFEPFVQADNSLDRTKGGLGLGLALVKAIVELHNGRVEACSDGPGQGSILMIELPLEKGPMEVRNIPMGPARATSSMHVLIIEDNEDAAETLRDVLELHGHRVEVAYSGAAGVEMALQSRPDVVLCDLGLPGMDGYQVAAALRANPLTAATQLIAASGYGQDEDKQRSKRAGFDLHLTKPLDLTRLNEMIGR